MNILFSHKDDYTTKAIHEWIVYLGGNCIRINDESLDINELKISNENFNLMLEINNNIFNKNEIDRIWYRGGKIRINNNVYDSEIAGRSPNNPYESIISHLSNYNLSKKEYIIEEFSNCIGRNATGRFNKMIALKNAKKVGLSIPETLITKSKKSVIEFKCNSGRIITKSLDLGFSTPNYMNSNNCKYRLN